MYQKQTERLIRSYESGIAWGNVDHEQALHTAIDAAFSTLRDEVKAELYAAIMDQWESYKDGMVPRKLWIGTIVRDFFSRRTSQAVSGLTVTDNIPKEEPNAP